jgi:2-C-methyl-D-erythritol 4-phosphate cytidylyltransferase
MKKFAIIVAGGQGIRMQGVLPKQFLPLDGEPVLAHTLRRFHHPDITLVLVMNAQYIDYWKELSNGLSDIPPYTLVAGGDSRAESVANGLAALPDEGLVAIHDAVRPLCSPALIDRLYTAGAEHDSAIPVIAVKDTLRLLSDQGSITVPRSQYRAVQTPQVFRLSLLKKAFTHPDLATFTDEASLFEAAGHPVHLEEGEESNIKLTVPTDMLVAASILKGI